MNLLSTKLSSACLCHPQEYIGSKCGKLVFVGLFVNVSLTDLRLESNPLNLQQLYGELMTEQFSLCGSVYVGSVCTNLPDARTISACLSGTNQY